MAASQYPQPAPSLSPEETAILARFARRTIKRAQQLANSGTFTIL